MNFPPEIKELLARYRRERGSDSPGRTAEAILELHRMFSGQTPLRPGYLSRQDFRRAYVQYYLPQHLMKVRCVLDEMERYAKIPRAAKVLDFGCGPGSASLAYLVKTPPKRLVLVDVVEEALDDADWLIRTFGKAQPEILGDLPEGPFDVILAANVLVERHTLQDLLERLAPKGYLVVVEPALRETTRRLMEWRDELAAGGWKIAAPCLGIAACPMRAHSDLWCHQDVGWSRPGFVADMDGRVGLDHTSLKYSYLVVTRQGKTLADLEIDARIVSNVHKEKGKAWGFLCGREGPLCRLEVLNRHRSPEVADFFHADRGDLLKVRYEGETFRSEGPIRKISDF